MRRLLLVLACLVCVAPMASAQLATNPTIVEFSPSADHDAMMLDGTTPVVDHYDLRIYLEGASEPFQAPTSLGKPAPVDGKISVVNSALFAALATGLRYTAKVAAVGPTGEGVSLASNPFGIPRTTPPLSVPPPVIR